MRVQDVMSRDPLCCTPDMPLAEVAHLMVVRDCGAIPVVHDLVGKKPIGILTDRDIVTRTVATGRDPMGMVAGDVMTSPPSTIDEGASLDDCMELLERGQIRRAIVVDASGTCVGIVAQADIALHAPKRDTGDLVRELSRPTTPAFGS